MIEEPPIGDVDAVGRWMQQAGAALLGMAGKRAAAARAAFEAVWRVRGAARDCEALLKALEQHGEEVEDAAGPEAPQGEIALTLWQWYEATRLAYLMCSASERDLRDLGAQVKGLVSQVRARPVAEAEEVRRRYRLPRDAREAVREHEEITARLAEEAIDQETIAAARTNLLTFATYMKRHFRTGPHLEYLCAALERVERGECKRLVINIPPQHGKLCADSTPVLTPTGWTTHGQLKVGDEVYGLNGYPTKVVAVSEPSEASLLVKTTDGAEVRVHPLHEWQVFSRRGNAEQVLETQRMRRQGVSRTERKGDTLKHRSVYLLPRRPIVQFSEKALPVHPYVFGAWLGDGSANKGCITHDPKETEVIARVVECGYPVVGVWTHKTTGVLTTNFGPKLGADLRLTEAWKDKHIPHSYKFASATQRLELLAGLIDTDGSLDTNGRVRIVTVSDRLAADIVEVVRSLGMRAAITTAQPCLSTSGIQGTKPVHYVAFNPSLEIPTQLKRKATKRLVQPHREGLGSIEPCAPEMGRCIQVAAQDGIYLVGRELIPTHNSEIVSRLFPAWYLGRNPSKAVLLATHTATYVEKLGRSIRNNISSDEFSRVFPAVTLSNDSQAAAAFEVVDGDGRRSKRGVFNGYGMGGSYTGTSADLLIFDDLLTEADSNSEAALATMRESVQGLYTRLASDAAWIVVNTRYNERDTVAYLLSEYVGEGWEVVSLPALAERDEEFPLPDGRTWTRRLGEALFPFRYPREWLERRRQQLMQTNPSAWWGQYQCRPTPASGNLVRLEWFNERRYRDSPIALLDEAARVTVSVDTSKGATEKAARTAISVWCERVSGAYLIHCYSRAIQTPEQLDVIKTVCQQWRPQLLIIEDKSTGESLIPLLRRDTDWVRTPILAERPRGSKVERMSAVLPQMADGQVWLPCDGHPAAPWLPSLLDELAFYPKGAFLDQGDTVSQFLLWRSRNPLSASPAPITAPKPVANAFAGSWGLRPTGRRTSW